MNSSQLKSYLTGLILGDATIDKGTQNRAFYIRSISDDWAKKIYSDLSSVTNFKIRFSEKDHYTDKNNVHHKKTYEIYIKSHPYFAKIYHLFYNDYRERIIHLDALKHLDWQGWANWFMSDGYIVRVGLESGNIKDRRVQLCTDRYSLTDIENLKQFLSEKYGIETTIIKRYLRYRLNIRLKSAQDFLLNINPYVVESMKYKLDMCYDYQPVWMNDQYYHLMQSIQQRQTSPVGE